MKLGQQINVSLFFMLNDYLSIKQACSIVFDERLRPIYRENE